MQDVCISSEGNYFNVNRIHIIDESESQENIFVIRDNAKENIMNKTLVVVSVKHLKEELLSICH